MSHIEIALSAISVAVSLSALGLVLFRKPSFVASTLLSELDLATEVNKRQAAEIERLTAELKSATVKLGADVLASYAKQAVAYAEQVGGTAAEKLEHAMHAARKLDAGDNGKRDWSDAQIRIAIEAQLQSQK